MKTAMTLVVAACGLALWAPPAWAKLPPGELLTRENWTQKAGFAPETVPGDGGSGFKTLNSFDLEPGVKVDMQRFRPQGRKLESIIVPGKEWTEFSLDGMAEYSELHYLLSGIFGANQVTQPTTVDTSAHRWQYILSQAAVDEVQTYGCVKGDENDAESYSYVLLTELGMELSREGIKIDGAAIGHEAEFNASAPPHPVTGITEVPLLPKEVNVHLTDTYADIVADKLTRALMVKQTIGDRHNPVWVLDRDEASFVNHVELAPKFEIEVTLEANDQGKTVIDSMRSGGTLYLRLDALSPELAGAATQYHQFTQDAAVKVADVDKFEDSDGVYAIKYTFAAVYDPVEKLSVESTLYNKQATF